MSEKLPITDQQPMFYGPAVPGVEHLLKTGQEHLLAPDLNVLRSDQSVQDGWRVNQVFEDNGHTYAQVARRDGPQGESTLVKDVQVEGLAHYNQRPVAIDNDASVDTVPRSQLVKKNMIQEQLDGPWKEVKVSLDDAKDVGKSAVKEVVDEPVIKVEPDQGGAVHDSEASGQGIEQSAPEVKLVFASPDKLVETLEDPGISPQVKEAIQGVVSTWKEIEKLEASSELWDSVIRPTVETMSRSAGQAERVVSDIISQAEGLQSSLRRIADAVYGGRGDDVADAIRRARLGDTIDEFAAGLRKRLPAMEDASGASIRARLESDEARDRRRKMDQAQKGELTTDEADSMLKRLAGVVAEAGSFEDLQNLSAEELQKVKKMTPDFNERLYVVDEAVKYMHRGAALEPGSMRRIVNELEMILDESRRGRYDGDRIEQTRRMLNPLLEDLDAMRRFMKISQMHAGTVK